MGLRLHETEHGFKVCLFFPDDYMLSFFFFPNSCCQALAGNGEVITFHRPSSSVEPGFPDSVRSLSSGGACVRIVHAPF